MNYKCYSAIILDWLNRELYNVMNYIDIHVINIGADEQSYINIYQYSWCVKNVIWWWLFILKFNLFCGNSIYNDSPNGRMSDVHCTMFNIRCIRCTKAKIISYLILSSCVTVKYSRVFRIALEDQLINTFRYMLQKDV